MREAKRSARSFLRLVNEHELFGRSAEIAFYLFLSIFPFLIFISGVLTVLPIISVDEIMSRIENIFPEMAYDVIHQSITKMVNEPAYNIISLSFLFSLWTASQGMAALMRGLNREQHLNERRGFVKVGLMSIFFTICFAVIIIFSITALVFGDIISSILLQRNLNFFILWKPLRIIISFALLLGLFILAFMFMPSERQKLRQVIWGSLFSTVAWLLVSTCFAVYVKYFGSFTVIYGGIGGIIVLMLWFYLLAFVCLLGGEVNTIANKKRADRVE